MAPPESAPRRDATMKSILIAEGDDLVAELFASLFARDGWTVTTCLDGQRAADALGGSVAYDAVVVSNQLHNMGGVELITRIRGLAHRQDVPIVMVTGTVPSWPTRWPPAPMTCCTSPPTSAFSSTR